MSPIKKVDMTNWQSYICLVNIIIIIILIQVWSDFPLCREWCLALFCFSVSIFCLFVCFFANCLLGIGCWNKGDGHSSSSCDPAALSKKTHSTMKRNGTEYQCKAAPPLCCIAAGFSPVHLKRKIIKKHPVYW